MPEVKGSCCDPEEQKDVAAEEQGCHCEDCDCDNCDCENCDCC